MHLPEQSKFIYVKGGKSFYKILSYINKMCITNKLSADVEFSLSNDCPMKISYDLGDDSSMIFFMAPKLND